MVRDPYQEGMTPRDFYFTKERVRGRVVAVLKGKMEERGLSLLPSPSRALVKNEIHELLVTDEEGTDPIHGVAYLAFIVIEEGGVVLQGEGVIWRGEKIGTLLGFDGTHLPNHYNIVLHSPHRFTGEERGIHLGDCICFEGLTGKNL